MAKLEGKMLDLNEQGRQLWADLGAILGEHLPDELLGRARGLAEELQGNSYSQAFLEIAQLYRALVALMPDDTPQIRAAYAATVFEHDMNEDADWQKFEREGLP